MAQARGVCGVLLCLGLATACQGAETPPDTVRAGQTAVPDDEDPCQWAQAQGFARSLLFAFTPAGEIRTLTVAGATTCTLDRQSTARGLVFAGLGGQSSRDPAALLARIANVDTSPIEHVLEESPSLTALLRDPSSRTELLEAIAEVAATVPSVAEAAGVFGDERGFDGLTFGTPYTLTGTEIVLSVEADDDAYEYKSVVVGDQPRALLRAGDMFDVIGYASARPSSSSTTVTFPVTLASGPNLRVPVHVVAPSWEELNPPFTLVETGESFAVDQRSLATYGFDAIELILPDILADAAGGDENCIPSVVASLTELVAEIGLSDTALETLKLLFTEIPEILVEDVIVDCVLDIDVLEMIVEVWDLIRDLPAYVQDALQQSSRMLAAFARGPALARHEVSICGACPGASETNLPSCWINGGSLECGPMECTTGQTESASCGNCGQQTRSCVDGMWSGWSACTGQGACAVGTMQACGAGGTQTCDASCAWGTCGDQMCAGSSSQACGSCGTQTRTCDTTTGQWSTWGACTGEGACSPGTTQSCGSSGQRVCTAACGWSSCNEITVTAPVAGALWLHHGTYTMQWTSVGVSPPLRLVATKGGVEVAPTISTTAAATGSQPIVVPDTWAPGSDYRLCATANAGSLADCSELFSIGACVAGTNSCAAGVLTSCSADGTSQSTLACPTGTCASTTACATCVSGYAQTFESLSLYADQVGNQTFSDGGQFWDAGGTSRLTHGSGHSPSNYSFTVHTRSPGNPTNTTVSFPQAIGANEDARVRFWVYNPLVTSYSIAVTRAGATPVTLSVPPQEWTSYDVTITSSLATSMIVFQLGSIPDGGGSWTFKLDDLLVDICP